MAENNAPQNRQDDDELSVEELDDVAGGGTLSDSDSAIGPAAPNTNCGTNCHC